MKPNACRQRVIVLVSPYKRLMSEQYRCSKDTGENYSIVPAVGWLKIEGFLTNCIVGSPLQQCLYSQ